MKPLKSLQTISLVLLVIALSRTVPLLAATKIINVNVSGGTVGAEKLGVGFGHLQQPAHILTLKLKAPTNHEIQSSTVTAATLALWRFAGPGTSNDPALTHTYEIIEAKGDFEDAGHSALFSGTIVKDEGDDGEGQGDPARFEVAVAQINLVGSGAAADKETDGDNDNPNVLIGLPVVEDVEREVLLHVRSDAVGTVKIEAMGDVEFRIGEGDWTTELQVEYDNTWASITFLVRADDAGGKIEATFEADKRTGATLEGEPKPIAIDRLSIRVEDYYAFLTPYRPQHLDGYAQFARTAVAEDDKSTIRGPGIRINNPGDEDILDKEDDLIEVVVHRYPANSEAKIALRRNNDSLKVWTTSQATTEIPFTNNKTGELSFAEDEITRTVWVEWADEEHGAEFLQVQPLNDNDVLDTIIFHTFRSIVVALGGAGQAPADPINEGEGTFQTAIDLYRRGFDVWMFAQASVDNDGTGVPYSTIVDAVDHREVESVAVFGFSKGGGATYDLVDELHEVEGIHVALSGYIDAIESWMAVEGLEDPRNAQTHRPPGSSFHINYYQQNTGGLLPLNGAAITDLEPGDIEVNTSAWEPEIVHGNIDDDPRVRIPFRNRIEAVVPR